MKQESILLTPDREKKPRPHQLAWATGCHRGLPHLQTLCAPARRAEQRRCLHWNFTRSQGQAKASQYTLHIHSCISVICSQATPERPEETTAGRPPNLTAMKNCGCGHGGSQVSWGIPCRVRTPRGIQPLSPSANTAGCAALQLLHLSPLRAQRNMIQVLLH